MKELKRVVKSHMETNRYRAGLPHHDYQPTPEEEEIITAFCTFHEQYTEARGQKQLDLYTKMDALLEALGLDNEQRTASIKGLDAFDIF